MFTRLRGRHPAGLIAVGVVITLVLSGTAMAITDRSFTYSTVQTGYLMIGPADLVPNRNTVGYSAGSLAVTADSNLCFNAGVHVPQGARIISVRTSYHSGPSSDVYISFVRANPVTDTADILIPFHSVVDDSGAATYVNDVIPATLTTVNNALHAYTCGVCVGSTTFFHGARITYQYTNAGD